MRIYLIGYMGAGKTTVSKRIAGRLGFDAVDLDQLFEEKYKIEIASFFTKYDEKSFRKLESEILKSTSSLKNVVIATGGGTPCFFDNMEWMNRHGITVYIDMKAESLFNRLTLSKRKRPLVLNKSHTELLDFIKMHLQYRNNYYCKADIIIKGENLDINQLLEHISTHIASK